MNENKLTEGIIDDILYQLQDMLKQNQGNEMKGTIASVRDGYKFEYKINIVSKYNE